MKKLRQTIGSLLMFLAVTTVNAQVPATELVYPKPQDPNTFGMAVAVYDQYTVAASEYENDVYYNGQNNTYHGTVRLFQNNQYVRTYTYGNGANLGIGRRHSVAIGEHAIIAGAPKGVNHYVAAGNVLVAHRQNNGTYQSSFTVGFNPDPIDNIAGLDFGESVSIDGNWIAVGAPGRNNKKGGVYMYEKTGYQQWSRRGWIPTYTLSEQDRFGFVVRLSGENMIVAGGNTVYIYRLYDGITWIPVFQYSSPLGRFLKVDITNEYAVATIDTYALVFKKTGPYSWTLFQTITGPQRFGLSAAISNQNLIVSNDLKVFYYQLQSNFTLIGSMYIPNSNPATGRLDKVRVGFEVDIHGDRIIASAINTNYTTGLDHGAVFTDFFYNGFANWNHLREGSTEVEVASPFSVYPNPSASNVSFNIEEEILNATATNAEGVTTTVAVDGTTLLVEELTPGLYFLNVETASGRHTAKFVKQ